MEGFPGVRFFHFEVPGQPPDQKHPDVVIQGFDRGGVVPVQDQFSQVLVRGLLQKLIQGVLNRNPGFRKVTELQGELT